MAVEFAGPPFMAPPLPPIFIMRNTPYTSLLKRLVSGRGGQVVLGANPGGGGGWGTTTLAIALCHDPAVREVFPDGILWATLGERPNLPGELARLILALIGTRPACADLADAAIQLAAALAGKRCLLVIDGAWDNAHVLPFLHGGPTCVRLITTRTPAVAPPAAWVKAGAMTDAEAGQLLGAEIDRTPSDLRTLKALAKRLGGWPLLLAVANAVLRHRLAQGERLTAALMHVSAVLPPPGDRAPDLNVPRQRNEIRSAVLTASLATLTADERAHAVQLAVFPPDAAIPLDTVARLWNRSQAETAGLVALLAGRALLQWDADAGSVRLHDEVCRFLASQVANPKQLHAALLAGWGDPPAPPDAYAWEHLAYHLLGAGRRDELRRLLLDFTWMQARLAQGGVAALLADADYLSLDWVVHTVAGIVKAEAATFAADPAHLARQFLLRLTDADGPAIAALRAQAQQALAFDANPWLRPLFPHPIRSEEGLLRALRAHSGAILALAAVPAAPGEDEQVITASDDDTLKLWNLTKGTQLCTLQGHTNWVRAVAVTRDGRLAVSGSSDRTVKVWDLASGAELQTLEGHTAFVWAVAVTGDGRRAVSGAEDGTLKVWDLTTGTELYTLAGPGREVTAIALTPDDRRAVVTYADRALRIWELDSGSLLNTLTGHDGEVRAVAVMSDGQRAISGSADRRLKIWDLASGAILDTLTSHTGWVTAVAVTPDGQCAVSGADDGRLVVWDLASGLEARSLAGKGGPIRAVAVTSEGGNAVCGTWAGDLQVWDIEIRPEPAVPGGHKGAVMAAALTDDGRLAVTGATDNTLKVWDVGTGTELRTLTGHRDKVTTVAMTGDGRRLVSGSSDGTLKVWDLDTGAELCTLPGAGNGIRTVAMTPDGRRAISGSESGALQVWDLDTGAELRTLPGYAERVVAVAITPDGRSSVSGARNGPLQVWDLDTGAEVHAFDVPIDWTIALPADGQTAIMGTPDGPLEVRNLQNGATLRTLVGHPGSVWALTVTPNGRWAVSGDSETVKVWDVRHESAVAEFDDGGAFYCCAITPDGRTLVSGDEWGRVHFLRLEGA